MKKKFALILILTLLLALGAFAACGDPHEHDLQHFEAKDPTCEKDGNIEYSRNVIDVHKTKINAERKIVKRYV